MVRLDLALTISPVVATLAVLAFVAIGVAVGAAFECRLHCIPLLAAALLFGRLGDAIVPDIEGKSESFWLVAAAVFGCSELTGIVVRRHVVPEWTRRS